MLSPSVRISHFSQRRVKLRDRSWETSLPWIFFVGCTCTTGLRTHLCSDSLLTSDTVIHLLSSILVCLWQNVNKCVSLFLVMFIICHEIYVYLSRPKISFVEIYIKIQKRFKDNFYLLIKRDTFKIRWY